MAMDITLSNSNPHGNVEPGWLRLPRLQWTSTLLMARSAGWVPRGAVMATEGPETRSEDAYVHNDGALMDAEDCRLCAEALRLAIEADGRWSEMVDKVVAAMEWEAASGEGLRIG